MAVYVAIVETEMSIWKRASAPVQSALGSGLRNLVGILDGAALVLARIRSRFPWRELVWADAGYDARQVKATVAAIPVLTMEIVRRSDDVSGFDVERFRGETRPEHNIV